jgi:transcriptional regulator with XRE-family HTH domain
MYNIRLRELRKEMKLTQGEIAEKIGVALTTYAGYEQAARNPDWQTLVKLSEIFGVSLDYLIGRTNERSGVIAPPNKGEILIAKAEEANVSLSEIEAYITARKLHPNN